MKATKILSLLLVLAVILSMAPAAFAASTPAGTILYFDNTADWSTVNIYYWSDSNTDMTAWPGETMTLVEGTIYSFVVPADATYVIFNNGSAQTSDLTIPETDDLYTYDSGWSLYESGCAHNWGDGTITTAATCTASGVMTYTCSLCGDSYTEEIPATGHSYADGACVNCGAVEGCVDHVYDEGVVTMEKTCWTAGVRTYTCTLCGATKTETIYAGHDIYVSSVVEPTCTSSGKQYMKCTGCAYSMDKTLPKLSHDYSVAGEVVAATCTTDGYTVYTCATCTATQNGDITYHTGHSFSGNTCTACGEVCEHSYVDGICENCSDGGPAYVEGWYEIANAAQLRWFASQVNSGNNAINGKLVADIDLENATWTAIGAYCPGGDSSKSVFYKGIFDGNGHTVSNFTVAGDDSVGLFGYAEMATIQNLGVINATATGANAGAVVGYAATSTILNCYAKDCTITGYTTNSIALTSRRVYVGAIAGQGSGYVYNCYAVNCTLVNRTGDMTIPEGETYTPWHDFYASPLGGNGSSISNNFYYNITGTFSSTSGATEVTLDQLTSGEVTYLLNKGVTDGTQAWYQTCGEGMPAHSGKTVYQLEDSTYTNDITPLFPEPTITLQYPTLLLEDVIKMNVYFTLDQDVGLSELGMLTWTSAPSTVDISTADAVIPGAVYYSDLGYYGVTTEAIPAQNLGDVVYFCIYAELADGTYAYGKQVQYSPTTYAYNQLKAASTTDAAKSLYVAILNYGAAAQTYLGYNTDALINASLTDEMKAYVNEYSSDMVHSVSAVSATKQGSLASNGGFSAKKPSISLDGAFAINYYFTPSATVDGEMTFYYWNAADFAAVDVLSIDNATGSNTMVAENGVYSAAISGIAAKDIDGALYACGVYTDAEGNTYSTGILPYSLGVYCGNQAVNGTEKVQPLAAAIAVYGYYAANFFAGN